MYIRIRCESTLYIFKKTTKKHEIVLRYYHASFKFACTQHSHTHLGIPLERFHGKVDNDVIAQRREAEDLACTTDVESGCGPVEHQSHASALYQDWLGAAHERVGEYLEGGQAVLRCSGGVGGGRAGNKINNRQTDRQCHVKKRTNKQRSRQAEIH